MVWILWIARASAWNIWDDDAYSALEIAHRKPGQSIDEWATCLHKTQLEVEAQDHHLFTSDTELASKMLRGAGLPQEKRAQVLFKCGGIYDPLRMETVLRASSTNWRL